MCNGACVWYIVMGLVQDAYSDGISNSSSSGSSSISNTKKRVNSGVIGRLEGFQSVDPCAK